MSIGEKQIFKISHNFDKPSFCALSRVLLETPQTEARQAPLSMGFSRQERWSDLPSPSSPDVAQEPQTMSSVGPVLHPTPASKHSQMSTQHGQGGQAEVQV